MTFEVIRTGPLALIQDAGRFGYADLGVGRSGAADRGSFRAANRLLDNQPGAAAIECVLGGLVLAATVDALVAVTGADAPVTVDDEPADPGRPITVRAGQRIRLGTPRTGLRSYLAVAGGVGALAVLGSRSTDTLSGLGPAPLRKGDRLPIGPPAPPPPAGRSPIQPAIPTGLASGNVITMRATPGPRADWFRTPADLAVGDWVVSAHSNRIGVRLDRHPDAPDGEAPMLRRTDDRELPSEGLVLGAVQIPPSGQPVLFLADHPVTGGYPVIAVVRDADIDIAAQLRPGQRLRFRLDPAVLPPT